MLKAGPAACWLWVCGIAHSQSQTTDGFISFEVLPMIGVKGATRCRKLAEMLVSAGLFDRVSGGYAVHDYHAFNATREEALVRRVDLHNKRAIAGRLGGLRSGEAKRQAKAHQNAASEILLDSKQPSKTAATGTNQAQLNESQQTPSNLLEANPSPDPTYKKERVKNTLSAPAKEPPDPRVRSFLLWFVEEYARRRFGAVYLVAWERDAPLVKRMLKAVDEPKLRRLAQMLLSRHCNEPFIEETDRGIGILSVKFNWLSERLAKWDTEHAQKAEAV